MDLFVRCRVAGLVLHQRLCRIIYLRFCPIVSHLPHLVVVVPPVGVQRVYIEQ
jgi:hypothetical protein